MAARHNFRKPTIWKEGNELAKETHSNTKLFPKSESYSLMCQMKRAVAESLYLSGRTEEADLEFLACAKVYLKDPWSYIIWGDMYAGENGQPCSPDKAEELYRKALGIDPQQDETVRERIAALRKRS